MITSIQNRATTGKLLALAVLLAAIASLVLAARPAHAETTFTVKNTNDSGPGSLRQAMFDANVTAGADVIDFNIDGSGVHTIAPESALPTITEAVSINGYSQPGSHPNTKAVGGDAVLKIELSDNTQYGYGLVITGSNSTVKGLVINRWDEAGIKISGSNATGNRVVGNFIGTDHSGTQKLGNYQGIHVYDGSNNTIGGTVAGARNVISASQLYGVGVSGDTATGNRILSNSIFSNAGLGIDLGADGITPNDPDDADTGPNYLQNFPVLSSAKKGAAGKTTVRGTLDSTPGKNYTVQLFSNPSGTDEGKRLLGSQVISTDGSGDASFAFSTEKEITLGQNMTATATGPGGNTSELSAPRKVVAK